jgi:hypothetical protein
MELLTMVFVLPFLSMELEFVLAAVDNIAEPNVAGGLDCMEFTSEGFGGWRPDIATVDFLTPRFGL